MSQQQRCNFFGPGVWAASVWIFAAVSAALMVSIVAVFGKPGWLPDYAIVAGSLIGVAHIAVALAGCVAVCSIALLLLSRRPGVNRSGARSVFALRLFFMIAGISAAAVLVTFAATRTLHPNFVEVGAASENGCHVYVSELAFLGGEGGTFYVQPSGTWGLYRTEARWASAGEVSVDPGKDIGVVWSGDRARIVDRSGRGALSLSEGVDGLISC